MRSSRFAQIWRAHLTVAFLAGLILGATVGLAEGITVLVSQGLQGRYNELVAWAILFDTCAVVAVEIGLAVLNAVIFTLKQFEAVPYRLVALQLGESFFAATLAFGLWTQGTANPRLLSTNFVSVIWQPAIAGILLGEIVLVMVNLVVDQLPLIRRLDVRFWLVAEAVIVIGAIAFSFTH